MENEVRELLRRVADDVQPDGRIPRAVVLRSRRRRGVNAAIAGVAVGVVAAAAFLGVRAMIGTGPDVQKPIGGGTEWRGIWPQSTREEAEAAQASADAGDRIAVQQLDPYATVTRYGSEVLGLGTPSITDESDPTIDAPNGPAVFHLSDCSPRGTGPATCTNWGVTIERLLRKDATGLWFVTSSEQLGEGSPPPIPTPAPATEADVRTFVQKFMDARVLGRGAEDFLTAEAKAQYDQHASQQLWLYDDPSCCSYTGSRIVSINAADAGSWEVVVSVDERFQGQISVGAFRETLFVGPGQDLQGVQKPLLIRGADGGRGP